MKTHCGNYIIETHQFTIREVRIISRVTKEVVLNNPRYVSKSRRLNQVLKKFGSHMINSSKFVLTDMDAEKIKQLKRILQ